jgi:hypothetical protein
VSSWAASLWVRTLRASSWRWVYPVISSPYACVIVVPQMRKVAHFSPTRRFWLSLSKYSESHVVIFNHVLHRMRQWWQHQVVPQSSFASTRRY